MFFSLQAVSCHVNQVSPQSNSNQVSRPDFCLQCTALVLRKIFFCRRNKTVMKLVLPRQCCTQKTAENRSSGNCAGASHTLFHHCLLRARPARGLASAAVSCWLARACPVTTLLPLTFSPEHHLQPAASVFASHSQSHSDVNAKTIR